MRGFRYLALLALFVSAGRLCAHEDLQLQIADVTRRIQQKPRDASLFLKRGELHRALREWDLAASDYDRAAQISPSLAAVDFARGAMWLAAGKPDQALAALDRFLGRQPNHAEARVARARTLARLGRNDAAAEEYGRALALHAAPRPEYFLERSHALLAAGRGGEGALRALDDGIRKLGPLVTLELPAIDLELKARRYDAALARVDLLTAQAARRETFLEKRGQILEAASRRPEARTAYAQALAAIATLPGARRYTPSTAELEKRLREALRRSGANSNTGAGS